MLNAEEKITLLSLRLLIARAAQKDSLKWWEDDSLTPAGFYILERLFLADPGEAGRKLALEAARTRYQAAFNGNDKALHLFRLDKTGEVAHALDGIYLSDIPMPLGPILTLAAFKQSLSELAGQKPQYKIVGERANHSLEIGLKRPIEQLSILDLAKTLAWAVLEGQPGQPIFPYIPTS